MRTTQRHAPLPSMIMETCLNVADLPRSQDFYTALFGYAVIHRDSRFCALSVSGRQVLILFVRGSDPVGTHLPIGTIPPHGTTGPAHIGFGVPAECLPAWENLLGERGIPVESSVTWPTGGRSVYFRDPDGHLLELLTPGTWSIY